MRRHPKKNTDGVRTKYFRTVGGRNWVFAAPTVWKDGGRGLLELYQISGTDIRRHKKIKGDLNPFDPMREQYSEQFAAGAHVGIDALPKTMGNVVYVTGRVVRALWLCPDGGWHDHHLEYRMHGGSNALFNRVLLHPHCHQQVHAGEIAVIKLVLS
jgi:RNA-directed DNA polymerase